MNNTKPLKEVLISAMTKAECDHYMGTYVYVNNFSLRLAFDWLPRLLEVDAIRMQAF